MQLGGVGLVLEPVNRTVLGRDEHTIAAVTRAGDDDRPRIRREAFVDTRDPVGPVRVS